VPCPFPPYSAFVCHFQADELWVDKADGPVSRVHLAFQAPDRETVAAFHRAALAAGGRDNGGPGERHYHPGYYGAFVLDPDGNNIEAVFHGPATRSAPAVVITPITASEGMAPPPSATDVVRRYWSLMATNDFTAVGAVLADEFVLEWPQSNERIRGRERFARMNAEYPAQGRWSFEVERLVGGDDAVVSDVRVTDGVLRARALSFFTVADGRVTRIVEYWPDPFPAPANRAHLVEPIE